MPARALAPGSPPAPIRPPSPLGRMRPPSLRLARMRPLARMGPLAATLAVLSMVPAARAASPAGPPPAAVVRRDPACGAMPIVQAENRVVYRLPHAFLTAIADSVLAASGTLYERKDYVVDRLKGELRLLRSPVPRETLWVEGCWLIEPPSLEYQRQTYVAARPAAPDSAPPPGVPPPRPATAHDPQNAPVGTALNVSGNKTIAVDFGSSQDAFLRQSLDLSLSGTLGPGVQLTGVLSDRNTPLTAAGSTQDLQALDRVLLELRAPAGGAAFGDVALDVQQGEFAQVQRRLQGVRADWNARGFSGSVAAASAQGEFHRLQFFGVDGQQGPYLLTDRDGGTGITIVAGSEIVTVDGARMTRGEGADYSIEYDRARVTFSNRRPITSASRITVDYQYTANRYRRSFASAGGRWDRGPLQIYTQLLSESDDRGRPLDITLDASDQAALALAGDSLTRAVGAGVTAGGGDYDTVRVAGRLFYAFAGPDSGQFSVRFVRVGDGYGDYADSSAIAGRITFRYVGQGAGAWRIGRALPLPESHQLWSLGGRLRRGPLSFEAEGAMSRRDLNTASALDDADNAGAAGRLALALDGGVPGRLGRAGVSLSARGVESRFTPFGRLERPFSEEDWGLPVGGDLERQRRLAADGYFRPRTGGELKWTAAALRTPQGFRARRTSVEWSQDARLLTHGLYQRAEGTQSGVRFDRGGRDRGFGEIRLRTAWVEPGLHAESDIRRTPSDSSEVATRFREGGVSLQTGRRVAWRGSVQAAVRRDANASADAFVDQSEARTLRLALESPTDAVLGVSTTWQRRDTRPLTTGTRQRSDLASLRLATEDRDRGLSGSANLEVTAEGESRRVRSLLFVGGGRGAYDALGNFVGHGDYDLGITVLPGLDRVARAALSARTGWTFGASEVWRGSRVEFFFETDVHRRGDLLGADAVISPGRALGDPALARSSVDQRLESDLAPGARFASLRLRLERRVSADRSFDNFAQTLDQRTGQLRWRLRGGHGVSAELEARAQRQSVSQELFSGSGLDRTLLDQGGSGQLIFEPGSGLRLTGVVDATWSRPEGQPDVTRTLRVGPDLSAPLGGRGRGDLSIRRSFVKGPPSLALIPSADPSGAPLWEANVRADLRVRESTTAGISYALVTRPGIPARSVGRVELRAFF